MTITVYNEAGEVVTDPQEQARKLREAYGGKWVVVYNEAGEPTGVAATDPSKFADPEVVAAHEAMNAETDAVRAAGGSPYGLGIYGEDGKRIIENTWSVVWPKR